MIDSLLHSSFTKMYQIVEVESGDRKNPVAYRIQTNKNFTYEECYSDSFVKEPCWEFADNTVFSDSYQAVKHALNSYDYHIKAKLEEYVRAKNATVIKIIPWESLTGDAGDAINALGKKPKPPLM